MPLTKPDIQQFVYGEQPFEEYAHKRNLYDDGFFRSIVGVIPWRDTFVDALLVQEASSTLPFPQGMWIDEVTNQLFITCSGPSDVSWVRVFDFPSLEPVGLFGWGFFAGQSVVGRWEGSTRYLYTVGWDGGNVRRADITFLPALLSNVVSIDLGVSGYHDLAFDGRNFYLQKKENFKGDGRRNIFDIWNAQFSVKSGRVIFPMAVTGDFGPYVLTMNKSQNIVCHNGQYYFPCGGDYVVGTHGPEDPYRQTGIKVCDYRGDMIGSYMQDPGAFVGIMNENLPTGAGNYCEFEGLASYKGDLYGLIGNREPSTAASFPTQGWTITKEFSRDKDRIDFRPAARALPGFNETRFQQSIHESATQLTDPVTGAALNSFADICGMMRGLGLSEYKFRTSGQTINDVNAAPVSMPTLGIMTFTNISGGSTFLVSYDTLGGADCKLWWLSANATVQNVLTHPRN